MGITRIVVMLNATLSALNAYMFFNNPNGLSLAAAVFCGILAVSFKE